MLASPPFRRPRPRRLLSLALLLGVSGCGGAAHFRQTHADNAREDDPWFLGERCTPETPAAPALRVEVLEEGIGVPVEDGQTVRVHYVARLPDGKLLHDTRDAGPPIQLVLGSTHTICGFERALLGMRAGEQRRVLVPWSLGFGEGGRAPDVPARADLVLEVRLFLPSEIVQGGRSAPQRPAVGGGGRRR
jgi:hypothetical protein